MNVTPYLLFDGRCDEALAHYRRAVGAEVTSLIRMKDMPDAEKHQVKAEVADKVLHCSFRIGDTERFATDGSSRGMSEFAGKQHYQGFQLALTVNSPAEATQYFAALSEGGQAMQPLIKTFFSPSFGMTVDRFGVQWIVMARQP